MITHNRRSRRVVVVAIMGTKRSSRWSHSVGVSGRALLLLQSSREAIAVAAAMVAVWLVERITGQITGEGCFTTLCTLSDAQLLVTQVNIVPTWCGCV